MVIDLSLEFTLFKARETRMCSKSNYVRRYYNWCEGHYRFAEAAEFGQSKPKLINGKISSALRYNLSP